MFDPVYDDILFVGEIGVLKDQNRARAEGITAIVRLDQIGREHGQWSDEFVLLDMPIPDGESLDADTLDTITNFIHQQIEAGGRVLIHCQMGVSRSVAVAMAYLIAYERMTLAESFGTMREARAAAFPHEKLLISLIDRYGLPYDTTRVRNPQFLARLLEDA
jgi:hypothetical protein